MATASSVTNTYSNPGVQISENFSDVLDVRFRDIARRDWDVPIEGLQYWEEQTTTRAYEKYSGIIPDGIVPKSPDSDPMPNMRLIQDYDLTITPVTFRQGIKIEQRLIETEQFGVINKMMEDLNAVGRDTIELYAVRPFNTAFATVVDWICADGMNLIDTTRPFAVKSAGSSWDNEDTSGVLSQARIGTMRLNFKKHKAPNGRLRPLPLEKVVIPSDLEDSTITELQSVLKPGSSLHSKNYLTNYGITYQVWHYLTSTTAWFGFAPKRFRELIWLWGKKPSFGSTYPTGDYPNVRGKYIRFVFQSGAIRPHGVRGNQGT